MSTESAILSPSIGWILLAIFGILWVYLGYFWGKKAKSLDGFMLAGRNVGLALGTATAVATWITSNTTMLAPQFAFQMGVWGMVAYSTASLGLFLFAPLAKRIRLLMPNGFTSGDFIRLRYGKPSWYLFLVISVFYSLTWLISMGMAGGALLEALSGIPYEYGMTVILIVCVGYTLFGGLYAVIGTDFIQTIIILAGIVVVAVAILMHADISDIYANVSERRPALLDMLFPAAIMAIFNNLLFGLGEIFHSNVWWSRAFAMREGIGKKAYTLAGIIWLPIPIAAGFIALSSGMFDINVVRPDMVGPMVAAHALGKYGAILIFIVVFCSLASSIDSLLAATSDLITEDFYKKIFNPRASEAQLRKVSAIIILTLGILTWVACVPRVGTLATVLFFAGPLVGSAIWPILAGLYWKKANGATAAIAMLIGSLSGLWAYFQLGWYTASLIGTIVSMIIVFAGTLLSRTSFQWSELNEKH